MKEILLLADGALKGCRINDLPRLSTLLEMRQKSREPIHCEAKIYKSR